MKFWAKEGKFFMYEKEGDKLTIEALQRKMLKES